MEYSKFLKWKGQLEFSKANLSLKARLSSKAGLTFKNGNFSELPNKGKWSQKDKQ